MHGTFVGEKINKVRWKPEDLTESDIFLTGSWDNGVRHLLQNFQERDKIWNIIARLWHSYCIRGFFMYLSTP